MRTGRAPHSEVNLTTLSRDYFGRVPKNICVPGPASISKQLSQVSRLIQNMYKKMVLNYNDNCSVKSFLVRVINL